MLKIEEIRTKINTIAKNFVDLDEMNQNEIFSFVRDVTDITSYIESFDLKIDLNKFSKFTEILSSGVLPNEKQNDDFIIAIDKASHIFSTLSSSQLTDDQNNSFENSSPKIEKTSPKLIDEDDIDFAKDYLDEMCELLEEIEKETMNYSLKSFDSEAINTIFRGFHSIKGNAGIMEHHNLRTLAHSVEDILDLIRSKQFSVNSKVIDLILETKDVIQNIVSQMSPTNMKLEIDDLFLQSFLKKVSQVKETLCPFQEDMIEFANMTQEVSEGNHKSINNTIRIDIEKLDNLVDLVSELIISSNSISGKEQIKAISDIQFINELRKNSQIISQLQKSTLSLRMIKLDQTFSKMKRVIRDYVKTVNKDITLTIIGEDTEIDRSFVTEIYEPLMHLVRNCCDHGIETPEKRSATAKPKQGEITIRSYHKGNNVIIEVEDDGEGLNRDKIITQAMKMSLINDNSLTDSEVFQLILKPGFSTSENITNISGRGVGMDVVSKTINKLGGKLEISSIKGKGSKFKIFLPLTLAIMEGLFTKVNNDQYVIPIGNVKRMIQPKKENINIVFNNGEYIKDKDKIYPIVRLSNLLAINSNNSNIEKNYLIITSVFDVEFALLVDEIVGIRDLVVKQLNYDDIEYISSCTILSDSSVALILDLPEIYEKKLKQM